MRRRQVVKRKPIPKFIARAIWEAENDLKVEGSKQLDIVMCSSILALNRYWGWKTDRLSKLLFLQQEIWDEVGADNDISMIKLLDEECDIELTNHEGVSYKDVIYLNAEIDTGKDLSPYEWLRMRQNQKKWIECQIMACVFLALHRKEGWGAKRVKELLDHAQAIKEEFNYDPKLLCEAVMNEAHYDWLGQLKEQEKEEKGE